MTSLVFHRLRIISRHAVAVSCAGVMTWLVSSCKLYGLGYCTFVILYVFFGGTYQICQLCSDLDLSDGGDPDQKLQTFCNKNAGGFVVIGIGLRIIISSNDIPTMHIIISDVKRGQKLEAEAKAKILALRPVWPRGLNASDYCELVVAESSPNPSVWGSNAWHETVNVNSTDRGGF